MLTVRYRGMWRGFTPDGGGLPELVQRAASGEVRVVQSSREPVDLEVSSVFQPRLRSSMNLGVAVAKRLVQPSFDYRAYLTSFEPSPNARRSIWYTGENLRPPPPSSGWDLTLSFESDDWPRNVYLPLWLMGTDAFGRGSPGFLGRSVRLKDLVAGRPSEPFTRRPKFACAFVRNPESTRIAVIDALRELGEVDVFGPLTGRRVPSKAVTASDYRFMVCLENDLYPGYVTEKPVEAWAAGCIPLWWGLDRERQLNSQALLNLASYSGLDSFLERVSAVDLHGDVFEQMWRSPLLCATPGVDAIVSRVRELL